LRRKENINSPFFSNDPSKFCDGTAWITISPSKHRLQPSVPYSAAAVGSTSFRIKIKSSFDVDLRQGYSSIEVKIQLSLKHDHPGMRFSINGPLIDSEFKDVGKGNVCVHTIPPLIPDLVNESPNCWSNRIGATLSWNPECSLDLNLEAIVSSLDSLFFKSNTIASMSDAHQIQIKSGAKQLSQDQLIQIQMEEIATWARFIAWYNSIAIENKYKNERLEIIRNLFLFDDRRCFSKVRDYYRLMCDGTKKYC